MLKSVKRECARDGYPGVLTTDQLIVWNGWIATHQDMGYGWVRDHDPVYLLEIDEQGVHAFEGYQSRQWQSASKTGVWWRASDRSVQQRLLEPHGMIAIRSLAESAQLGYGNVSNHWRIGTNMPRKPKLSQHLRDARVGRGLSVAYVAQQVDVSTASVYFWETGYCRPRSEHLKTLCKVLKLPIRATQELAAAS